MTGGTTTTMQYCKKEPKHPHDTCTCEQCVQYPIYMRLLKTIENLEQKKQHLKLL
jgi:hypothetical protein